MLCGACGRVGFDVVASQPDGVDSRTSCLGAVNAAYVQSQCAGGPSATAQATFLSDVQLGSLLVVAVNFTDIAQTPAVSDTLGSVFTAVSPPQRSSQQSSQIWYAPVPSSGPDTVTVTFTTSASLGLYIHEFVGVNALDTFSVGNATGLTVAVPPITTLSPNEMLFVHCAQLGQVTSTSAGFVVHETCTGDLSASRMAATPGTYGVDCTALSSGMILVTLAAFERCP